MFAGPIQDLIDELSRLPGIGPKSAQRVAFYLLKTDAQDARRLAQAIADVKTKIRLCRMCFNFSDEELCEYCRDPRRDPSILCVVQDPPDIVALERTREYRGMYHVLQGGLSPIDGIGPENLKIKELIERLRSTNGAPVVEEVILATNPNTEGTQTALYLARLLVPSGVRVTRLASGLPVGGDLEYADEVTLGRALEGRRSIAG